MNDLICLKRPNQWKIYLNDSIKPDFLARKPVLYVSGSNVIKSYVCSWNEIKSYVCSSNEIESFSKPDPSFTV